MRFTTGCQTPDFSGAPDSQDDMPTGAYCALVAQLDRALDYESRGREFESSRARHFLKIFVDFGSQICLHNLGKIAFLGEALWVVKISSI